MWLSRKSFYNLVSWAKNETAATGEDQKMILGYGGYDVIQVTNIAWWRETTHSKLKKTRTRC